MQGATQHCQLASLHLETRPAHFSSVYVLHQRPVALRYLPAVNRISSTVLKLQGGPVCLVRLLASRYILIWPVHYLLEVWCASDDNTEV